MNDPELRAAFARLDAALAEARAALEKPEPEQEQEQEQPSVEVGGVRFRGIVHLRKWVRPDGSLGAYCTGYGLSGEAWRRYVDATPFSIWQAAVAAGVPCPGLPSIELTLNIGDTWRMFAVTELSVSASGNTSIRCLGGRPQYAIDAAIDTTMYVTESPAAIRAACAEKGVPCPEGEKPETVDIISANTGGIVHLHDLRPIEALIDPEHGPCLRVNGYETKAPISDIRAQAAEAGIELPEVTVVLDGNGWKSIEKVTCRTPEGKLRTVVYGDGGDAYVDLAPAQVVALCKLAGWPKPEVRMVCTLCSGDPCPIDPTLVRGVYGMKTVADAAGFVRARHTCVQIGETVMPDFNAEVREPVAVVQRMIDACKEGE